MWGLIMPGRKGVPYTEASISTTSLEGGNSALACVICSTFVDVQGLQQQPEMQSGCLIRGMSHVIALCLSSPSVTWGLPSQTSEGCGEIPGCLRGATKLSAIEKPVDKEEVKPDSFVGVGSGKGALKMRLWPRCG